MCQLYYYYKLEYYPCSYNSLHSLFTQTFAALSMSFSNRQPTSWTTCLALPMLHHLDKRPAFYFLSWLLWHKYLHYQATPPSDTHCPGTHCSHQLFVYLALYNWRSVSQSQCHVTLKATGRHLPFPLSMCSVVGIITWQVRRGRVKKPDDIPTLTLSLQGSSFIVSSKS